MNYRIITNGSEFHIQCQHHVHILWWMWTWWKTRGEYFGDMECLLWRPLAYKSQLEAEGAMGKLQVGHYQTTKPAEQWWPVIPT